ncbi:uncharacterized protein LOC143359827 [Halictus rubicundus]|uniref:uncharacterized protein LOC143359827 n=1 Tax=Halictus rubicundus TaxID=77578 RepID=UPI004036A458
MAIKMALGLRMSTPSNVVLSEACIPYMQDRASLLCKLYLSKIISNTQHSTIKHIEEFRHIINSPNNAGEKYKNSIINKCIKEVKEVEYLYFKKDNYSCLATDYRSLMTEIGSNIDSGKQLQESDAANYDFNTILEEKYKESICIYTDGSKGTKEISTGAAIYCPKMRLQQTSSIHKAASVYTAECYANTMALNLCLEDVVKSYVIITDSLSAVQSLTSVNVNVKTNNYILEGKRKLKEFIDKSTNNSKVEFMWIPSHRGIEGNEVVDRLAKTVTITDHNEQIKIPYTDFKQIYSEQMWEDFQDNLKYQFISKGILYYENYYDTRKKPWFHKRGMLRDVIVRICRLRSNHYNTKESLARKRIIESTECECRNPVESMNHILWDCPLYDMGRQDFIKKLRKLNINPPVDISYFLSEPKIRLLKILKEYCDVNDIKV